MGSSLKRVAALAGMAMLCAPGAALAQAEWPNRPVKLIVPFGAGGSSDVLARIVAEQLGRTFKQQFVVENRPGAGGVIGVAQIASADPDGYTIGITNLSTLALAPFINQSVAYDPMKSLTHIAYVGGAPVLLSAAVNTNVKTIPDFVAFAKAKGFTFVSSGVGSDGHLMGKRLRWLLASRSNTFPIRRRDRPSATLWPGMSPSRRSLCRPLRNSCAPTK